MKLVLGNFSFEINEVWHSIRAERDLAQTGGYMLVRHHWTIKDWITSDTGLSNLVEKMQAREQAAANITGDVLFQTDDGSVTLHRIPYAATLNGIRGRTVSYPGGLSSHGQGVFGSGSEMADEDHTFRFMETTIEAEEISYENEIVFYWDTYEFSTGGTDFVIQGAFQGLPRRFNTMQNVPCWGVQRGRAIGMTTWPSPAAPVVGGLAMKPRPSRVRRETPERNGKHGALLWPLHWYYRFEDVLPLPGAPNPTP